MITLGLSKPSSKDQTLCLSRSKRGEYNYDAKYVGATRNAVDGDLDGASLKKDGYRLNHGRVKVGAGIEVYKKAKELLKKWGHFQLGWTFVDRNTPIGAGEKLCVCIHELILWFLNPLEILFVNDGNLSQTTNLEATKRKTLPGQGSQRKETFYFVVGTLKGHMLRNFIGVNRRGRKSFKWIGMKRMMLSGLKFSPFQNQLRCWRSWLILMSFSSKSSLQGSLWLPW